MKRISKSIVVVKDSAALLDLLDSMLTDVQRDVILSQFKLVAAARVLDDSILEASDFPADYISGEIDLLDKEMISGLARYISITEDESFIARSAT